MTIDHASAVWGYGGTPSSATIAGQQAGYRTGRLFPVAPSNAGESATIRPYVVPWTPTADLWGVAFPAGLVGVTQEISLPSPLVGTINAGYESQWASFAASMIPVPAVLPVGYTVNPQVDWQSLTANLARVRTAAGWVDKTWLPTTSPNGFTLSPAAGFPPFHTTPSGGAWVCRQAFTSAATGWRKVQLKLTTRLVQGGQPAFPATPITINHNADGTNPGDTSASNPFATPGVAGDTLDFSGSVSGADFSDANGDFFWDTPWIDCGAVLATLGTLAIFQFSWDTAAWTGAEGFISGGFLFSFRMSPRCDVPYPTTVLGQGDLIAPGGYVP